MINNTLFIYLLYLAFIIILILIHFFEITFYPKIIY